MQGTKTRNTGARRRDVASAKSCGDNDADDDDDEVSFTTPNSEMDESLELLADAKRLVGRSKSVMKPSSSMEGSLGALSVRRQDLWYCLSVCGSCGGGGGSPEVDFPKKERRRPFRSVSSDVDIIERLFLVVSVGPGYPPGIDNRVVFLDD